jgi:hypothetical protein
MDAVNKAKLYEKRPLQELREQTKPYIDQQLSVPSEDSKHLIQAQIANIAIQSVTSEIMANVRSSRNKNVDEAANFTHDRIKDMREIISKGQGTNAIVQSIQKESFSELKRQHNQILGDLKSVRQQIDQLGPGEIENSGTSDATTRWKPTTLTTSSNDRNYVGSQPLQDSKDKNGDTIDRTDNHEADNIPYLANSDASLLRPSSACDYFSYQMGVTQNWHPEGELVCNKSLMYRCVEGTWIKAGNCKSFRNWRSKIVQKLELRP